MNFKLNVVKKSLDQEISADILVVFAFEDKTIAEEKLLDEMLGGQIRKLRASKDFTAGPHKTLLLFGSMSLPRILLTGLGKLKELSLEKIREGVSAATKQIKDLPIKKMAIVLPKLSKIAMQDLSLAISEALALTNYEFSHYKAPEKDRDKLSDVELILFSAQDRIAADKGMRIGQVLANAVNFARDLGNHPSNIATPSHLAKHAEDIAKSTPKVRVKILHKSAIKKENMGALLAVSQGSDEEPKFIILEYRPRKTAAPIVLVGKGITFDSGGISIKPSDKMEEMKYDMAGAATVMGTIKAAADLNLPINLVGLIPATENLPSGKAVKPGDIIRSRSGKTIEVVNTDAEGRLVLADALDYAKQYKPSMVVDFATLTGAIVVALGDDLIGTFSNNDNLVRQLQTAATITGEKIWPMPLEEGYDQFIKSDFADLRNIGTMRYGDSINAALFLKNFVDYPWIHLDIAGTAWATREKPYRPKGATGIGIRLMIEFLQKLKR